MSRWRTALERAFEAQTVAVVGDKMMNGFLWLRALQNFSGKLYSVQIDPNEIPAIEALGVLNVLSLDAIPEPIDYVIVAVPRTVAPRVVADCGRLHVGAAMLFTAGFSETGDPEGLRLEQEIGRIAAQNGLLIVGPNCMGLANPSRGLCNFPGQNTGAAAAGPCGFFGQSGTHTITSILRAPVEGVGISKAVSFGNAIVADAVDYLDYLAHDDETKVIAGYVEGVRRGREFFETLRATTPHKPVVLWKGGLTEAGQRAIFSHTAALATPEAVWTGMLRQAGAIGVDSQDELFDVTRVLLADMPAQGIGAGLIAMTGGPSVALTDAFCRAGLRVPLLSDESYKTLSEFFQVVGGSFRNPLDAGGTIAMGLRSDNLGRLLDVLNTDTAIDLVTVDLGLGLAIDRWLEYPQLAAALTDILEDYSRRRIKPLSVIADAPQRPVESARLRDDLRRRGVLTFASAPRAARALRLTTDYYTWRHEAAGL